MSIRNCLRAFAPLFAVGLLQACGGGGGGGGPPPPPPPVTSPSALSYAAPPVYTVNTAITAMSPTVTGAPTGYTVSPTLPAGLALNGQTGVISGTPMAVTASANYQVTASNSGGSTSTTLSITVNDVPPSVDYARSTYVFATAGAVSVVPTATGGAVVSWSIDHALPAGLTFSTTTGAISGTPTQVAAAADYVITAQNSGGNDTFALNLAVANGVLVELGHVRFPQQVIYDGTRIASLDGFNHAVLWNAQNSAILATQDNVRCDESCGGHVALAGNSMVTRNQAGFIVRSSADGSAVSTIAFAATTNTWWRLATDGSYIVAGDGTGLNVWSRAGALLFTRAGNYVQTQASAAPGTLRLAKGPAGASVIESISVPGNGATLSPAFNGTFHSWFLDGERFLTTVSNTVFVYSKDAAQVDIAALTTVNQLAGTGNFFWVRQQNQTLNVYTVGSAGATVTPFTLSNSTEVIPSGSTLGLFLDSTASIGVVDLALTTPVRADFTAPSYLFETSPALRAYAALSSSEWVFATGEGTMLGELNGGGTPQLYARGSALSVAGSDAYSAVATADGVIQFFDTTSHTLAGTIAFAASKIALSKDGSVLAAMARNGNDRSLRFYSLPSGNLASQMPYTFAVDGQAYPTDFVLSDSGDVVGLNLTVYCCIYNSREVRTTGGTLIWSDSDLEFPNSPLRLSPNANLLGAVTSLRFPDTGTNIFTSGTLTTAVPGWGVDWLDDTRLLVNRYVPGGIGHPNPRFNGTEIYNASGTLIASPALPEIWRLQRVSANTIYSPELNEILDLTTGSTVWSSSTDHWDQGAVAGNDVVFAARGPATVRVEPR